MFTRNGSLSSVVLRFGLGLGFLSAVADRFGVWGAFGQPNVEWGNYSRFLEYTHSLNWYLPAAMTPLLGAIATAGEILFGLLVLVGWHTRVAARRLFRPRGLRARLLSAARHLSGHDDRKLSDCQAQPSGLDCAPSTHHSRLVGRISPPSSALDIQCDARGSRGRQPHRVQSPTGCGRRNRGAY